MEMNAQKNHVHISCSIPQKIFISELMGYTKKAFNKIV